MIIKCLKNSYLRECWNMQKFQIVEGENGIRNGVEWEKIK